MATYSNNTTIKFLQGVTLVNSGSYTVPAGCYAILSYADSNGGPGSEFSPPSYGYVYVDGQTISYDTPSGEGGVQGITELYIPEGKVISVSVSGKGTSYAMMSIFKNSP